MTQTTAPHSEPGASADVAPRDHILIFDTTLRDGEQCPGATMTFEDKLEVAELLDSMGVDIIEAGFPIASLGDFEAVSAIAKRTKTATIAGLARAIEGDIARCGEAVRHAHKPRIHTFVSTSPIHLAHQMNKSNEEVLEIIRKTVAQARNLVADVEWSAMDATRTPIDYLCRCIEAAIGAGATTINLPDTVGFATPTEYEAMFRTVRERVPNADKAVFSTHCHDDLGLAVANSLAGVAGGARQIECTINGLGERAGNAALEEVVMAVRTRADRLPYKTGIETTMLTRASKLVSAVSSFPVQYNKAIVGRNAFAHESGIHQDGMLKNAMTYEIMTPDSVGLAKSSLVMGKHSGRHAFKEKLKEMGYVLGDNALQDAFARFKDLADRKKIVYDEDIEALVDDEIGHQHERIKVLSLDVHAGTHGPQTAEIALDIDGTRKTFKATGNGPVDAIFNAIVTLVPHNGVLELYQVHAVTQGTDAQAEVSVRLVEGEKQVTARGADPDTLVASARAYVAALNKLIVKRGKLRPDTLAV
jgi:2-isopropylmalate synthase